MRFLAGFILFTVTTLGCGRLGAEDVFSNPTWFRIPASGTYGNAGLYPSVINVNITPPISGSSMFLTAMNPTITNVRARINNLTHTFSGDLLISLQSPTGTSIQLFNGTGGGNNWNHSPLWDDAAAGPAPGPGNGPWQPSGAPLSSFDGQDPNGAWGLYIFDRYGGDSGWCNGWDLLLSYTMGLVRTATYGSVTQTYNQRATATNLDRIVGTATGDMRTVMDVLDFLTRPQFLDAMDQLHPEIFDAHAQVVLANSHLHSGNLERRLHEMRWGLPGFDFASLFGDFGPGVSYAEDTKTASDVAASDGPINSQKRWGFFALASSVTGDQDTQYSGGGVERTGFDFQTWGGTLGGDYRVGKNFLVGAAATVAFSDVDLGRYDSHADVRSISVGPYMSYFNNGFYADAEVSYSFDEYQTERRIYFPGISRLAKSDSDGWHVASTVGGGYMFKPGNWTVGPTGRVQYAHQHMNDFSEKEAGALNLHVDDRSVESLRSELGFRAAYNAKFGWGSLVPEVRARWAHEFLNDDRGITSQFIGSGAGSFTVRASEPSRESAFVGAGLSAHVKKNITTFMNYDVDVGRKDYLIHGGSVGFRVKF